MNIDTIKINELELAAYNPRRMTPEMLARLKKGIDTFGFVQPVVVNRRNSRIVGGHQRVTAARELGMVEVPVTWVDLDDDHEKALNLALNKIDGEWDGDMLKALLADLDDFDADLTGFGKDEIDELLKELENSSKQANANEDDQPKPNERTVARPGDLWILGGSRLLCGDSTRGEDVAKLTNGEAVDLVCTDPPYCSGGFQEAGKSAGSVGTTATHKMVANDTLSTRGYAALLKTAFGHFQAPYLYAFTDWRMWVYLFDIAESSGYGVRSMIVWDKGTPGMGRGWRAQHELVLWACRNTPPFDQYSAGAGNVIQASRTGNIHHTTEKPVELMEKLITNVPFARRIADPFNGSGTTLIACEKVGRQYFGIEMDPAYVDITIRRWQAYTGQQARHDDGRLFDEIAPA